MPECTHAPEAWATSVEKSVCHDCLRATALRVPPQGHLPGVSAAGELMGIDGWSNSVEHNYSRWSEIGARH
eukprot:479424-Prymnesium_polylepis.1